MGNGTEFRSECQQVMTGMMNKLKRMSGWESGYMHAGSLGGGGGGGGGGA